MGRRIVAAVAVVSAGILGAGGWHLSAQVPVPAPVTAGGADPTSLVRRITVVDRRGDLVMQADEPTLSVMIGLSFDGTRLGYALDGGTLMTFDIETQTHTHVAQGGYPPAWSPDGSRLAYLGIREGQIGIYLGSSQGPGAEERLFAPVQTIFHWTADGRFVVAGARGTFVAIPVDGNRTPIALLPMMGRNGARVSPDARVMAYLESDGRGVTQLWVRPVALGSEGTPTGGPWQVSSAGTLGMVRWRRDGRELYYLAPDGGVMAVPVVTGPAFEAGTPVRLFEAPADFPLTGLAGMQSDVSADGDRFVFMVTDTGVPGVTRTINSVR